MVNRFSRSPGPVQQFQGRGQQGGSLASVPRYDGGAERAAAAAFSGIGASLAGMADRAAAREGEAAGREHALNAPVNSASPVVPAPASASDTSPAAYAGSTSPIAAARAYLGKNEKIHTGALSQFFAKAGGQNLDPSATAWCAAFVNAALGKSGVKGTGSLMAKSFLKFGTPVKDASTGDVVVLSRGDPNGPYGHVGFVDGIVSKNGKKFVRVLGGNQSDAVSVVEYPMTSVLGFRRPATAPGVEQQVEMPPAGPPMALPGPIEPEGGDPFQLMRNGTIRGDAFDQAAIASYAWRVDADLSSSMAEAYELHKEDPKALAKAFEGIATERGEDNSLRDPELQEAFQKRFTKLSTSYVADANGRYAQRQASELKSAAISSIDEGERDLERRAYLLGGNPDGDQILGEEMERRRVMIASAHQQGALTAAEARTAERRLIETSVAARVNGAFQALPDRAAKASFADNLMDEWSAGKGPISELDYQQVSKLSGQLARQAATLSAEERANQKVAKAELQGRLQDDLASIAGSGEPLLIDGAEIVADDIARLLGPERAIEHMQEREAAQQLHDVTIGFQQMPPDEMAAELMAMKPEPGTEGYADAAELFQAAQKRAQREMEQREKDPAGAVDASFPELEELRQNTDLTDPEQLSQLGRARLAHQEAIGIEENRRNPLTAREANALSEHMASSPEAAAQMALTLSEAFDDRADNVLEQISAGNPGLAYAADFARRSGNTEALELLVREQNLQKQPGAQAPSRSRIKEAPLVSEEFGPALQHLGPLQDVLQGNAWTIFNGLARGAGMVPDVETPEGEDLYRKALRLAAGENVHNGVTYGGMVDVNGLQTLVPPDVAQGSFASTLEKFDRVSVDQLGDIISANGVAITDRLLATAKFVNVGAGRFHISLGDPATEDKRYITRPDGELAEYSFEQLQQMVEVNLLPDALARRAARVGRKRAVPE